MVVDVDVADVEVESIVVEIDDVKFDISYNQCHFSKVVYFENDINCSVNHIQTTDILNTPRSNGIQKKC